MSRQLLALFLLLSLFATSGFACLNPPDEHDRITDPLDLSKMEPDLYISLLIRKGHRDKTYWEEVLEVNSAVASGRNDRKNKNRIAVALVHLNKASEAIEILEKLERSQPGSYEVAANLGTAYELSGDNEKAYKWIAEGIKRNPKSHYGTEWLHLMILRAKQAIKDDPAWIDNNSVLGIDWNSTGADLTKISVKDNAGTLRAAADVQKALEYQLHERTNFVKPAEPVVASLLYDLGRILKVSRSEKHGHLILGAAALYGFNRFDAGDFPPTPQFHANSPASARPPDYTIYAIGSIIAALLAFIGLETWYTRRQESKIRRLN